MTSGLGFCRDWAGYPTVTQFAKSISQLSNYTVDNARLENVVLLSDGELIPTTQGYPKVVFVIGESFNPNHSPLYGYPINTTPILLSHANDSSLIVFKDVVSPSCSTGIMMNILFSAAPPDAHDDIWDYPLIPTLFKHSGYYVALHDNQCTNVNGDIDWDSYNCQFLSSPVVSQNSLDYRNSSLCAYDLDFVNHELTYVLSHCTKPVFEIYHLMGQHIPAVKRYPKELQAPNFDYSYRTDLNAKQIAEVRFYDNATFYNDLVIGAIIDSLASQDAVLVYVSDHGEEIHDFRNQYGRTYYETISKDLADNVFRVPLLIYTTPVFRQRHLDLYTAVLKAADKQIYSGDIGQMLLHLGMVNSRYYRPEHDPISETYSPNGRRILDKVQDYDNL